MGLFSPPPYIGSMEWELVQCRCPGGARLGSLRARVPGGWLVYVGQYETGGVAFVPDPEHAWVLDRVAIE